MNPIGSMVAAVSWQRVTYHDWFRTDDIPPIRRLLGHARFAECVGNLDEAAPCRAL